MHGGSVTVLGLLDCLSVSVLMLIVAAFFARQDFGIGVGMSGMRSISSPIVALLKRHYKAAMVPLGLLLPALAYGQTGQAGGEASLKVPDLSTVNFLGMNGHSLLSIGLLFCAGGLLFGMVIFVQLKNLPVHRTMREMSELIYETCKTYLITQGKFILLLWVFIAVIISLYFGYLAPVPGKSIAVTLPSSCCSHWWESVAATAWRGSESASTHLPIAERHSPDCAGNRIRCMPFR